MLVSLVSPQNAFDFECVRASFDVTVEQPVVRVPSYVTSYPSFEGKTFTTHVTLKWFKNFMHLFGVFSELGSILEHSFAHRTETLKDTRRFCVVSQHVSPKVISFCSFTTHMAGGKSGAVHTCLVSA
jgi:hypothetical protein